MRKLGEPVPRLQLRSSEFWCAEHISKGSGGSKAGNTVFCWVFWGFSGNSQNQSCAKRLCLVVCMFMNTTGGRFCRSTLDVIWVGVTKVLETVRKYLNGCVSA